MLGDVEVGELASLVSQHEEHVEDPKRCRRHGEEIDRGKLRHMVVEECSPCLGRRLAVPDHVLGDGSLGGDDPEQLEFAVYTRRSPERILAGELANETADFQGSCRSPSAPTTSRFPGPVQAKAAPAPAQQGGRPEDDGRRKAPGPGPEQPNPEQTLEMADRSRLWSRAVTVASC